MTGPRLLILALLVCFTGCGKKDKSAESVPNSSGPATVVGSEAQNIAELAKLPLTDEQVTNGWISLFDGTTLFGWESSSSANWRVQDGVIVADEGERGLLQTTFQFADFELKCDFRVAKGGNSGVFLRSKFSPQHPATDCYELNICDTHETYPTGSLVGRAKAPSLPPTDGQWHSWHVTCEKGHLRIRLDGDEFLDFRDGEARGRRSGHIGLQFNSGRAEFRRILLRPLGMRDLFDGSSLSGFRVVPGSKSVFPVSSEDLAVMNGPGFLETEDRFADFILQTTLRTNGKGLNSGIFFRAMRGTEAAPSNGYEMQIQNSVQNGDPEKPVDSGTGAIFRRQAVRRVNARDNEFFTATLIAQGAHIGTWVNGYQVVDWTDDRQPHENPRKGKRLRAGHISLQGHDATTDLSLRKLRITDAPTGGE